jgi:hypothetical protein
LIRAQDCGKSGHQETERRLAMGTIDLNDAQQIQDLADASGLSIGDVRDAIEVCRGDEFEVRNYLQNLILNRAINRKMRTA